MKEALANEAQKSGAAGAQNGVAVLGTPVPPQGAVAVPLAISLMKTFSLFWLAPVVKRDAGHTQSRSPATAMGPT